MIVSSYRTSPASGGGTTPGQLAYNGLVLAYNGLTLGYTP